ncbi:hypothetical protein SAMN04488139_0131 [Pseudidiomarina donghaiensis]|nr:hypothetical protein SAMN04488139_0131 [Pseudidiomarina donghaiensis]
MPFNNQLQLLWNVGHRIAMVQSTDLEVVGSLSNRFFHNYIFTLNAWLGVKFQISRYIFSQKYTYNYKR